MRYGKRSPSKRILASRTALVLSIVAFVLLSRAAWSMRSTSLLTQEKFREAENNLSKLQDREKELTAKVAYLSTDEGVEAEIRSKYRAVKEGESVAVIVDEKNATGSTQTAAVQDATTSISWWGAILQRLGL